MTINCTLNTALKWKVVVASVIAISIIGVVASAYFLNMESFYHLEDGFQKLCEYTFIENPLSSSLIALGILACCIIGIKKSFSKTPTWQPIVATPFGASFSSRTLVPSTPINDLVPWGEIPDSSSEPLNIERLYDYRVRRDSPTGGTLAIVMRDPETREWVIREFLITYRSNMWHLRTTPPLSASTFGQLYKKVKIQSSWHCASNIAKKIGKGLFPNGKLLEDIYFREVILFPNRERFYVLFNHLPRLAELTEQECLDVPYESNLKAFIRTGIPKKVSYIESADLPHYKICYGSGVWAMRSMLSLDPTSQYPDHLIVMSKDGSLYVAKEFGQIKHSSLLSGGAVRFAGHVIFNGGKIKELKNNTGHYRCTDLQAYVFLGHLNRKIDLREIRWDEGGTKKGDKYHYSSPLEIASAWAKYQELILEYAHIAAIQFSPHWTNGNGSEEFIAPRFREKYADPKNYAVDYL